MFGKFSYATCNILMMILILPLLIAGCGSGGDSSTASAGMTTGTTGANPGPLAQAVQAQLLLIRDEVAAIVNPETGAATTVTDFDSLYAAAGRLDSSQNPTQNASIIHTLLDRASDYDCEAPGPDYPLQFPKDHHIHPSMGLEWYYLCLHLDVIDPAGTQGRIGILISLQKFRMIGNTTQQRYGWSSEQSMIFTNLATATVDFTGRKSIIRRSPNVQWPAAGGSARYSAQGEKFYFGCGADSLSGSTDVLPLAVSIQDGNNLSLVLTLNPPSGFTAPNAFFLQGLPTAQGGGTGLTDVPAPGIYYSWPQLVVDTTTPPSLIVGGVSYTVKGGTGWIDHQLMMHSLQNAGNAVSPIPFTDDPKPYNGWCWQFFNLENGDAFTGAAFQQWYLSTNPDLDYGYYVAADKSTGKWNSIFISGSMLLGGFQSFPVDVSLPGSTPTVLYPTSWNYVNVESFLGDPLQGTAMPWYSDGTFNGPNLQVISEYPVDYVDTSGKHPNGKGYCESVGFEKTDAYRKRALEFLSR
ncbi:MAG: hypothetical protein AB9903_17355 [Vulcanimicrobiota bacterium]